MLTHMCACTCVRTFRGYKVEVELQVVVSQPMWVLGTDSGALKEQQVFLTTKPSHQTAL